MEETLNGLLQAEADRLCQAKRYQRAGGRADTRARYARKPAPVNASVRQQED